ncbi:NAD(P)/FAD-dependent oxidoreductase [Agitococcus lubricus]|uniref:NADH dehydrogenase n=1 Tax=Agitococcus lubricus TaxID=1077255 RepID=A0A2T5IW73_9GAMM|nr:FAD-dependent oxidoreductase [Agitococcus lubricus]PTQ88157.1 NADH dehydrogenase [Agitococcus lubricus]
MLIANRQRIVIIGANFAGMNAAKGLSARDYEVTVIDPSPDFEWLPHIHELISRHKKADQLRHDRANLIQRAGHQFMLDEVIAIDYQQQRVQLKKGSYVPYEQLIVAIGNQSLVSNIAGAANYAIPFCCIADAERAAHQLQRLDSLGISNRPVVLVGANIEGLEVLGEIIRRYQKQWRFQVHVIEQNTQLMPHYHGLDSYLRGKMRDLDITWHMGRTVIAVEKDAVVLDDGQRLNSRVTLWCAGAIPHPLLAQTPLAPTQGYAPVNAFLQSTVIANVWLAGDTVSIEPAIPKQAYHAIPMGALIAKNIKRQTQAKPLLEFKPLPIPSLMSFGETGFMLFPQFALASPSFIAAKEGVFQANFHLMKLPKAMSDWHNLKSSLQFSALNMGKLAKNTWLNRSMLEARRFEAERHTTI